MKILGITALTHDTGVALLEDGKLTHAINEERFSRRKMQPNFPYRTYDYIKKLKKIDKVVCSDLSPGDFWKRTKGIVFDNSLYSSNPYISLKSVAMMTRWRLKSYYMFKDQERQLKSKLGKELIRIEHHPNHAASAYFTAGFNKALVVTSDNHGDGLTVTTHIGNNGELELIDKVKWPHSPGFFYSVITKMLGFKPGRHEGKITGLAAYGNKNSPVYNKIKKLLWYENGTIKSRALIGSRGMVKSLTRKYSREDLSAVFQRILEEVMCGYVNYWAKKTGIRNIALAGGTFANVRVNQKIHELDSVDSVFIFPHMGDGGTGAGAAFWYAMKKSGIKPYKIENAYLGPEYSNEEIKKELEKSKVDYRYYDDIEYQVAEAIAKSKVVARFNGRMEYGPRALGNRSIMYETKDPSVNDWLNKRLKRSEFMPFAPVTLEEYGNKCFKHLKGGEHAAKFMTMCFDCTDYTKKNSPAIVHVDGTARPQLINKKINLSYYKIVDEYRKITGVPTLVNTSFNMHEEPIVCSPYDAIRAFKLGHLDYLAIGNYLVKNS